MLKVGWKTREKRHKKKHEVFGINCKAIKDHEYFNLGVH